MSGASQKCNGGKFGWDMCRPIMILRSDIPANEKWSCKLKSSSGHKTLKAPSFCRALDVLISLKQEQVYRGSGGAEALTKDMKPRLNM